MSRVQNVLIQRPDQPRLVLVYRVIDGQTRGLLFECCMNAFGKAPQCGACALCSAVTAGGQRCRRRACLDAELCAIHLRERYNVIIRPSNIPHGGLGLFAVTPRPLKRRTASRQGREPVFVKDEFIAPYDGVRLTPDEFNRLYDFYHEGQRYETTGPYAVKADDGMVIDGLCLRRVGAYANDYRGSDQKQPNARLEEDGLYAERDIFARDEVLVDYGAAYWETQQHLKVVQTPVNPDGRVRSAGPRGTVVRHNASVPATRRSTRK